MFFFVLFKYYFTILCPMRISKNFLTDLQKIYKWLLAQDL